MKNVISGLTRGLIFNHMIYFRVSEKKMSQSLISAHSMAV